jgi:hypothetical protein
MAFATARTFLSYVCAREELVLTGTVGRTRV